MIQTLDVGYLIPIPILQSFLLHHDEPTFIDIVFNKENINFLIIKMDLKLRCSSYVITIKSFGKFFVLVNYAYVLVGYNLLQ